jgi:hypothetical protein
MAGDGQRDTSPGRLARRPTDRIEDAVAWLLMAVVLLMTVVAAAAGFRTYAEETRRVDAETAQGTQVPAVLLAPDPNIAVSGEKEPPLPLPVPLRYTAPDGTERTGTAPVTGRLGAGANVAIWVDRTGTITAAPLRPVDAQARAVVAALLVLGVGWGVAAMVWAGVRAVVGRINAAGWEREWTQVEPRWSGRARS